MNNFYDDILEYNNQRLTGKALEAFENELQTNADLQKAVKEAGLVNLFQEELIEQDIQKNIENVLRSKSIVRQSEKPTIMRRLLPFAVAASVVLCLGFFFLSFQYSEPDYFAINQELLPIALDSSAELKGDMPSVIQTELNTDKAISLLAKGETEAAKPFIQKALQSNNVDKRQEAEYLQMSLLFMEGKISKAKKEAHKIAQTEDHIYQGRATTILTKVKKPWYVLF